MTRTPKHRGRSSERSRSVPGPPKYQNSSLSLSLSLCVNIYTYIHIPLHTLCCSIEVFAKHFGGPGIDSEVGLIGEGSRRSVLWLCCLHQRLLALALASVLQVNARCRVSLDHQRQVFAAPKREQVALLRFGILPCGQERYAVFPKPGWYLEVHCNPIITEHRIKS